MTNVDHEDNRTLLTNTSAPEETLMNNMERAAEGIGLYVSKISELSRG